MVGSAYGFEAKQSEFLPPYSQEATPQEFWLVPKLSAMHNTVTKTIWEWNKCVFCFQKKNPANPACSNPATYSRQCNLVS